MWRVSNHGTAHGGAQAVGAHDDVGMLDGAVDKLDAPLGGIYPGHGRFEAERNAMAMMLRRWTSNLGDIGRSHQLRMQVHPVNSKEWSAKHVGCRAQIPARDGRQIGSTDDVHLNGSGPLKVEAELL